MTSGTDTARAAKAAGFPDAQLVTAVAVAMAESGLNANAINRANKDGSADYGLWQINSVHKYPEIAAGTWSNPQINASMAFRVYSSQGWNAWSVHKPSDPIGYARYLAARPLAAGYVTAAIGPAAGAGGVIGTPGDIASGALAPAGAVLGDTLTMLRWLQDPRNWMRITKIVAGAGAILIAIHIMTSKAVLPTVVKVVTRSLGSTPSKSGKESPPDKTATENGEGDGD